MVEDTKTSTQQENGSFVITTNFPFTIFNQLQQPFKDVLRKLKRKDFHSNLKTSEEWGKIFLWTIKESKTDEIDTLKKLNYLWQNMPGRFALSCLNYTFTEEYVGFKKETTIITSWKQKENALLKSIKNHSIPLIEWCLEHGANPNVEDEHGNTAFMRLLQEFSRPQTDKIKEEKGYNYAPKLPMKLFIKTLRANADIFARNQNGDTTIMAACFNIPVIKKLILYGVNVAARNKNGENVLDKMKSSYVITEPALGGCNGVHHTKLEQEVESFLTQKLGLSPQLPCYLSKHPLYKVIKLKEKQNG